MKLCLIGIGCLISGFVGLVINKINEKDGPEFAGRPPIIDLRGWCYIGIIAGLLLINQHFRFFSIFIVK